MKHGGTSRGPLSWVLEPGADGPWPQEWQTPTNSELMQDLMLQLDAYKSMGPIGIYFRVLRELADVILRALSVVFQWSWKSGEVPVNWKLANVVPIFMKGKKEVPSNYRPVSLTSALGKIMEKIVKEHMKDNIVIFPMHLVTANIDSRVESPF